MFKAIGFWIYDLYRYFFDLKYNPLRHIPNPFTQFILMFYLSVMWTAIFTIWVGQTIYFGIGSVAAHLIVVGGFFITALTFIDAEKNAHLWVKRTNLPKPQDRRCVWDLDKEA